MNYYTTVLFITAQFIAGLTYHSQCSIVSVVEQTQAVLNFMHATFFVICEDFFFCSSVSLF